MLIRVESSPFLNETRCVDEFVLDLVARKYNHVNILGSFFSGPFGGPCLGFLVSRFFGLFGNEKIFWPRWDICHTPLKLSPHFFDWPNSVIYFSSLSLINSFDLPSMET